MQPLLRDEHGTVRFRENKIVRYLLDEGPFDLQKLAVLPFDREDHEQFAQLIGYSVSGLGELPYVSSATCKKADSAAERLREGPVDTSTPEEVEGDMRIAVAMMAAVLESQCGDRDACEVLKRPAVAESVRRAVARISMTS